MPETHLQSLKICRQKFFYFVSISVLLFITFCGNSSMDSKGECCIRVEHKLKKCAASTILKSDLQKAVVGDSDGVGWKGCIRV